MGECECNHQYPCTIPLKELLRFDSYSNYVDQATAVAQNLTYAKGNSLIMRADYWTHLNPNGPGRNSVRIQSVKQYSNHVAV